MNSYDYAMLPTVKVLGGTKWVGNNRTWRALRLIHEDWMEQTFVGGKNPVVNADGHYELKEDLRVLYTQSQDVPPYGDRD